MAVGAFVAGRYSATYDPPGATAAADIGITQSGYEIMARPAKEIIGETDAFGGTVVEGIFRGWSEVAIQATLLEWSQGALNSLIPYQQMLVSGATSFGSGVIARLDTNVAGILNFTSTPGTPSAISPATMTASFAILAENFNLSWILNSQLRRMPIRWRVYPYIQSGNLLFFTAA